MKAVHHPQCPVPHPCRIHALGLLTFGAGILFASPMASGGDSNANGLPDDWEAAHAGTFAVWPANILETLPPYDSSVRSFLLNNDTSAVVDFTATLSDNTVALYSALDSVTGGIVYAWDDISVSGTRLATVIRCG